jgi:hypothetical protein
VVARPQVPPGPLADLKAVLYELYLEAGAPTLDQVAAWIRADAGLTGAPGRDTVARIIGSAGLPPRQADVVAVATVLARAARWDPRDAARRARDLWVTARLASSASPAADVPAGPGDSEPGLARVADADLRRLGVHAAIAVTGAPADMPPEYVARETDDLLRAAIAAAAAAGGFVLLVGGSSVGKTRSAAEAAMTLLPQWRLVHPASAAEVAALAATPEPQTVVWLDELQRYLGSEDSVTGGVVRALLGPPHPAVIIATLWPSWYQAWTEVPASPGGADPHAREREILDLAEVIRIEPSLSAAEEDRARAAAARDRRLAVARAAAGPGLTQTLAAGPQLVARVHDARDAQPYAWAVITAALDAARLGVRGPLKAEFLRAAAPGYCTSRQRAEAPQDWSRQALAYAVVTVHGAAAALSAAGSGMSQVDGYTPADYLVQHVGQERRTALVPASTWEAFTAHPPASPDDLFRLAGSAQDRLLYCYSVPLYRLATAAGQHAAAGRLAVWLGERGEYGELRAQADAGDAEAAYQLADLLEQHGEVDEALQVLRAYPGADDGWGDWHLARLLARQGDLPRLQAEAAVGNTAAAAAMAELMTERGDLTGLQNLLTGEQQRENHPLIDLLTARNDLDGLRALASDGSRLATLELIRLLAERGELAEATALLQARSAAGDSVATAMLARRLAATGQYEEMKQAVEVLRTQAPREDLAEHMADLLADLLVSGGDLDGLRARAAAGDGPAARRLAALLAEQEDIDGLQALAQAGNQWADQPLVKLLTDRGDMDGLREQSKAGSLSAMFALTDLLGRRGDIDELRAQADAGDWNAAGHLAGLLTGQGDLSELLARTRKGDNIAARQVPGLLAKLDRDEDAERVCRFGLAPDGSIASSLPGIL